MIKYRNTKIYLSFRKYLKILIGLTVYQVRSLLNFSNERLIYLFLQALRSSSQNNKKSQLLTEFKIYPKYPKRLFPINSDTSNFSIIIQGPILDRSFVQGTIDWYDACGISNIIVSTSNRVKDFKRAKTIVYENSKIIGLGNENSHLMSIQKGLDLIQDQDIVLKTRSDMRIFNELALYTIPIIHRDNKSDITKDRNKLGVISNNSLLLKINNISDHLYIGNKIQLKRMFSIPFREADQVMSEISIDPNLFEKDERGWLLKSTKFTSTFTEFFGEQWFFNSFRKNCLIEDMSEKRIIEYFELRNSLSKYLDIIRNCIYVIDPEDLDLYWLKRNITSLPSYYEDADQNSKPIPAMRLTKLNWLSLYHDESFKEKILNYSDSLLKDESLF